MLALLNNFVTTRSMSVLFSFPMVGGQRNDSALFHLSIQPLVLIPKTAALKQPLSLTDRLGMLLPWCPVAKCYTVAHSR